MRKLSIMLAFMLVGSFAFAYNSSEEDFNPKTIEIEKNIKNTLTAGTCYFHMEIYNGEGELIQSYDINWESESPAACASESQILARFIIAPYL